MGSVRGRQTSLSLKIQKERLVESVYSTEAHIILKVGETYTELGAESKTVDGNILTYTTKIKKGEEVVTSIDTSQMGTYVITYKVESNGKTASITRIVTIQDGIPPVIKFDKNPVIVKITEVNNYNIYVGVTVEDNIDGIIEANSNNVKIKGELKSRIGEYSIIYEVSDNFDHIENKFRLRA